MHNFISKIVLFFCVQGYLLALPTFNPNMASLLSSNHATPSEHEGNERCFVFSFGLYGNYVFDRTLRVNTRTTYRDARISKTSLSTNAGICSWSFGDIALYGIVGGSELNMDIPGNTFFRVAKAIEVYHSDAYSRKRLYTKAHWSYGFGGNWTIYEVCGFVFGIQGQGFFANPQLNYLDCNSVFSYSQFTPLEHHFRYREWQIGFGCTRSIMLNEHMICNPYCNIKASSAKLQMFNQEIVLVNVMEPMQASLILGDLREHRWFGYGVGTTFVVRDVLYATIEGRWYDEKGIHVQLQLVL